MKCYTEISAESYQVDCVSLIRLELMEMMM